jgi:signal transduction histidine kinase
MSWIILIVWAGTCLGWFLVVLRRRLAPGQAGMPLQARLRRLGLGVFLLPFLVLLIGNSGLLPFVLTLVALALWTYAPPQLRAVAVPLGLTLIGLDGFLVLRDTVRDPYARPHYGLALSGNGSLQLLLAQAAVLTAVGLALTWRAIGRETAVSRWVLQVSDRAGGTRPRWGLLLLPLVGLFVEFFGQTTWLGLTWWGKELTLAVIAAAVFLAIRVPAVAADLALAGLVLFGIYGVALGFFWPIHVPLPSPYGWDVRYGLVLVESRGTAIAAAFEGLALVGFGLWLVPRALDERTRALLRSATDAELAGRVVRLTRTRADAVDTATTELRRLERDLHDGAQARLVALGMSLRAAERMILTNPVAAAALVAEARESSAKVLDELRILVRGICPPVLADRGLADAVRALALDTPLRTEVEVDLAGRPDLPIETACYFAVAEALANVVKHAEARQVQVRIAHADGILRISVIDDGCGGADPQRGTGLLGLERRLGTFDGVLAVNSPAGGPTIIAIEVPCTLTLARRPVVSAAATVTVG